MIGVVFMGLLAEMKPYISRCLLYVSLIIVPLFIIPYPAQAKEHSEPATIETLLSMSLEELIEVEISLATGSPKPIRMAPAVASVITAADIERMGATTLDEVLETVPGLHIAPSPTNRLNSIYSFRGIHTGFNPQVLLMINGIPHAIPGLVSSRSVNFRLPVANISRIEVVRGPGSAVHGADAFAGTINVITKDGKEIDGTKTGFRAGSFDTYDVWLQHGKEYKGWDVSLGLEYQATAGDKKRVVDSDLQSALDLPPPFGFGTSASFAPGPLNTDSDVIDAHLGLQNDKWTLRFWGYLVQNSGNGAGGAPVLDSAGEENNETFRVDITYNAESPAPGWDYSTRLYYQYHHDDSYFRLFPPGAVLPVDADGNVNFFALANLQPVNFVLFTDGAIGNPILDDHHTGLDFTAFYSGLKDHLWRMNTGAKYVSEKTKEFKNFGPGTVLGSTVAPPAVVTINDLTEVGTGDIYMEDQDRTLWYISMQDEWTLAPTWELTGGVRYDHYSDFGGTINPRVALVWKACNDFTSKILYGRAFRPPSFAELYYKNNPAALGNPDLDPETIDTYELAFDYQPTTNFNTKLNLYYYDIDDLIEYLPESASTLKAENARDQKGKGFEVEANWQVTDTFRLRGNFAYQRSKDKETKQHVADAPGKQLYLNPHWEFLPEWSLDGQLFWIADRKRAVGDTRPKIDDYTKVDLTLRRKNIVEHWDCALAIRNLFDEDIREPSQAVIPNDFPMESRSVWAEVRYAF
jgi:outer membrane receptor for ferrienterochelin and colicins